MTKLCTFYATKIQINDHEIDLNHDTEAKLGNLKNLLPYCQLGFSSKIGMPRLGSEPSRLGSSRKIPARTHH